MKVRLLTDDALILEAITPDRIDGTLSAWLTPSGDRIGFSLNRQQIQRLERFMETLREWDDRLDTGLGPPVGFDRDITNPEGK